MKDEIPQAVIDSHVKNAASARAEKVKQETSEENTGTLYKIQLSDWAFVFNENKRSSLLRYFFSIQ